MIKFEEVTKQFFITRSRFVVALKNINVAIEKGEFVSIVGPSGSGKSTLLALAGLLDKQTSGEIYLNGVKTSLLKDNQRTFMRYDLCGFLFQFASLTPAVPVLENVMLPMLLRGEKKESLEEQAKELLEKVGIKKEYFNHMPYQLSGGEQRRVAAARALLKKTTILFADEPTSALDDATASEMMQLFRELHLHGTTIVMVTHDKKLAKLGTSVLKIENGSLS